MGIITRRSNQAQTPAAPHAAPPGHPAQQAWTKRERRRAYATAYYQVHKAAKRAYNQRYYQTHRTERNAKRRLRYRQNPEPLPTRTG